jgi:hypothetical protein
MKEKNKRPPGTGCQFYEASVWERQRHRVVVPEAGGGDRE